MAIDYNGGDLLPGKVSMTDYPRVTVLGQCPSKSNSYIIARNTLIKGKPLKQYESNFYIQCGAYRDANIQGYFKFHIDAYFQSQRSDLDGCLKITLDCLQKLVKAFPNDNKCTEIIARKFLDKVNPRIEFRIIPVGDQED